MTENIKVQFNGEDYTLILPNYQGLKHKEIAKHFGGDLTYVAHLCNKDGRVWAFYHAANPDRDAGHKDFMMLHIPVERGGGHVSGRTTEEFEEQHNHQLGKACEDCKEIIYSLHRHDYRKCSCDNVMVDGGTDYFRASLNGFTVSIDFFNKTVALPGKQDEEDS